MPENETVVKPAEETTVVVTIDVALVDKQIAEHEAQFAQLVQNFQQIEREFNEKKDWAQKTLEQLRGAVLALRGLKEIAAPTTPPLPPATE